MLLTDPKEIEELISRASKTDAVGMDTEFVWERTYFPRLGLIQLALSDEECFLIDPCAVKDLSPIGRLLANPEVVKIFHDAPQDLMILANATNCIPKNIFDTRLGAGFAGLPATISLSNLLKELLEINLAKTETRTNWLKRPLNKKQVEYALDDVRYLRALRVLIMSRLINSSVESWLREELKIFDSPAYYKNMDERCRYLKIKGAGNLSRQQLAILRELAAWRDNVARKQDKPKGHIVQDSVLLCLAKNQVTKIEDIGPCGTISEKAINKYGEDIILQVRKALSLKKEQYPPRIKGKKITPKEKEELKRLHNLITLKSDIYNLDPALIGNTSGLKTLLQSKTNDLIQPEMKHREGWRKNFLADILDVD